MKEVSFEGIPSGDHECFCWDVDKETFIKLTGEEPTEYDESYFNKGLYMICPRQIMPSYVEDCVTGKGKKSLFTIKVEDI